MGKKKKKKKKKKIIFHSGSVPDSPDHGPPAVQSHCMKMNVMGSKFQINSGYYTTCPFDVGANISFTE